MSKMVCPECRKMLFLTPVAVREETHECPSCDYEDKPENFDTGRPYWIEVEGGEKEWHRGTTLSSGP